MLPHSDTRPDRKLSKELLQYGLVGEGVVDPNKVAIIKTHFPERYGFQAFKAKRVLLLIRNPFDTLDSYFNMVLTSSHTLSLEESEYNRLEKEWNMLVEKEIDVWRRFYLFWIHIAKISNVPLKLVRYEDLMEKKSKTLRGLACFLAGRKTIKGTIYAKRIEGLDSSSSVQVYRPRKGKINSGLSHFSSAQKRFVLEKTRDVLVEFGYTDYFDLEEVVQFQTDRKKEAEDNYGFYSDADTNSKSKRSDRQDNCIQGDTDSSFGSGRGIMQEEDSVGSKTTNSSTGRTSKSTRKGYITVNIGKPLRVATSEDPFARGMSWKKQALAGQPVCIAKPP